MLDKDLFALAKGSGKYVALTVFVSVIAMMLNVGITACICCILALAAQSANAQEYVLPAVLAAAGVVLRIPAGIAVNRIKASLGAKVKRELRAKTYDKIVELGVRTTEEMSMAGLTQVSMEGIEQLDLYYTSYLPQFFFALIAPVILFITCVFIDWRTATVLIACVPLIPLSIVAVSRYAKRIFAKYWGKYTAMGDAFLDSVQGLKELKIFKADARYHVRMNEKAEEFRKITMKVLVMQLASTTIMDFVAFGGAGAGIALAVTGVVNGYLSPWHALFLVLVAVEFFLPLRALGSAFHVAMNGASAGKKIKALLDVKPPVWGNGEVEEGDVRIEGATFSYDGTRDVLKDVNMTFSKGITAIVGESGSGKSTVVGLITGALRPQKGTVTVAGRTLDCFSRESYYSRLAVVSYNTYIFNQSVAENFRLAKKDVTNEEIYAALEKVNLAAFVRENGGVEKIISEDAGNISGGQKQRLALAINLVADKDIYVFDEATSNIDADSEAIISENIRAVSEKARVVLISHRLENVVGADKIYYLKDGRVLEQGTHESLCAEKGEYAALYNTQKMLEQGYLQYAQGGAL